MRNFKGFTLLELLVVIMIVALMTTLAGVNLRGKERTDLESIARTLMTDLRYIRSKAMTDNIDTGITIDVAAKTYFSRHAKIERALPQSVAVAVTLDARDVNGNRGKIMFYPDGSSSGGKIRLTRNARQMEVTTTWLNGYVTMR